MNNNKQSMKTLLKKLNACKDACEWAGEKTIEEIVEQCDRGDWLLWLAKKVDIGLQPLTLAKGHCANTVRHLMKDERSKKAVDTAIAFGEGKASRQELDTAAADAYAYVAADANAAYTYAAVAAYDAAYDAAVAGSYDASYASYAASYAADAYAYVAASYAADAYAYVAADATATTADAADAFLAYVVYYAARTQNQKETADICRQYIGQLIIDKCNKIQGDNNEQQ